MKSERLVTHFLRSLVRILRLNLHIRNRLRRAAMNRSLFLSLLRSRVIYLGRREISAGIYKSSVPERIRQRSLQDNFFISSLINSPLVVPLGDPN